jgi:hypothetical protein
MVVASNASILKVAVGLRKVVQCYAKLTAVGSDVNITMAVTRVRELVHHFA